MVEEGAAKVHSVDAFTLYKPLRNKISQLSIVEALYVVWAYSRQLQFPTYDLPKDIEASKEFLVAKFPQQFVAEWELETLTREIVLNAPTRGTPGRTLRSWKVLIGLVGALRHLENEIYKQYGKEGDILVELIRIAHRQFVWQIASPNGASAIRYFRIFDDEEIDRVCFERIGLTVRQAFQCGMAIFSVFLNEPMVRLPIPNHIKGLLDENVVKFLAFASCGFADLKRALRDEQQYNSKFAYAVSSLRKSPLIVMSSAQGSVLLCPLPTLLFWRMTGGLYYDLIPDRRFSQPYGRNFQRYVGEAIERACPSGRMRLLAEQQYGPKALARATTDWILDDTNAALFLECKSKRLSWEAKTGLDDLAALNSDIDHMANAVVQVYRTINDYLANNYPHLPFDPKRKIFPAVVTLENWHMFGPEMLSRLEKAVVGKLKEGGISTDVLDKMPYSVWAIEELERGMQIVDATGLLDFLHGKIADQEMRRWEWAAYMNQRFSRFARRSLFQEEYEAMFRSLIPT